ncbi:MAG: DGQHR domain-containing protein [Tenericutes bacterium]|nr:DGQHR domain-containing protein [Mycoplasmatota bacterium]
MPEKKVTKKKSKKTLSQEDKKQKREKSLFSNMIRDTFIRSDYTYINTEGQEISLGGKTIEVDKVFFYKNIVLICEETTTSKPRDIKDHIRKKIESVNAIKDNKEKYLEHLYNKYGDKFTCYDTYTTAEFQLFFLYFSKNKTLLTEAELDRYNILKIVEYSTLSYFKTMSKSIRKSTKYEVFRYLGISEKIVGCNDEEANTIINKSKNVLYPQTKIGKDKVGMVSFMMSPGDLIKYGYVLRKDNWEESMHLYQRLIKEYRIKDIRRYVATHKRTFYNNIIVSLPKDSRILDKDENPIRLEDMIDYEECTLEIPKCYNSICIIDGQHRVYAYHESIDSLETTISKIRNKLHFLVTGLIFPEDMSEQDRIAYQSKVFLDINSKSKPVPADVILHIEQLKNPYSPLSLARQVIVKLNKKDVFLNMFELSAVERAPIKVASIIKFALRYLVDTNKDDSLYTHWQGSKSDYEAKKEDAFKLYIDFAVSTLSLYFSALKESKKQYWDSSNSKLLSVISINGFILALQESMKKHGIKDFQFYKNRFDKLSMKFDKDSFPYTSSQYRAMSKEIAHEVFDIK